MDEITMIMAGMLPLALHPAPERIANIGWGSGLSTHTILGSNLPRVVDSIEIERAMVDGARLYGERVERGYSDSRSHIHVDDARTFFSTGARKYDAIISEPSNPWVSGVASLFTQEFYAFLKRHLEDDGILVQWLHAYEINDTLVSTMMAALAEEFPYGDLYLTNTADILIVARTQPEGGQVLRVAEPGSVLEAELRRVGLDRAEHFQIRRIGSMEVLRNFVRVMGAQPHSDFFPTVSLQAPRTRFMNLQSDFLQNLVLNGMPVLDILDCRRPVGRSAGLDNIPTSSFSDWQQTALAIAESAKLGRSSLRLAEVEPSAVDPLDAFFDVGRRLADEPALLLRWTDGAATLARSTIGHLPPEDLVGVWSDPTWLPGNVRERPEVAAILQAFQSAAEREPAGMRTDAERVLALPEDQLSPRLREQMVVLAMLGALGSGDAAAVASIEERWGTGLRSMEWIQVRSYLIAWADGPTPVCAVVQ